MGTHHPERRTDMSHLGYDKITGSTPEERREAIRQLRRKGLGGNATRDSWKPAPDMVSQELKDQWDAWAGIDLVSEEKLDERKQRAKNRKTGKGMKSAKRTSYWNRPTEDKALR
jgi:hypothetical protein